jgi:hypothetical protein
VKAGQMWKFHGHILEAQRVKIGPHSVDSTALNGGTMFQKNCVIRCSARDSNEMVPLEMYRFAGEENGYICGG